MLFRFIVLVPLLCIVLFFKIRSRRGTKSLFLELASHSNKSHKQQRFDRPLILLLPLLNKYARYQTIVFTQYVAVKTNPIDVFVAAGVMDQRNGKHASNIEPMFYTHTRTHTHALETQTERECVQIPSQMLKLRRNYRN